MEIFTQLFEKRTVLYSVINNCKYSPVMFGKFIISAALMLFMSGGAFGQTMSISSNPPLTPTTSTGTGSGITFNLHAHNPVIVTGMTATSTGTGNISYEIWYNTDSINGAPTINTTNNWVLHETGTATAGQVFSFSSPISIPAGETYGFCFRSVNNSVNYSSTNTSGIVFGDQNLRLRVGASVGYSGALPNPTITPRNYAGTIEYEIQILAPIDVAITKLINPIGNCGLTANEDVTIEVFNRGRDSLPSGDTIPLAYQVNGGTVHRDTLFLSSQMDSLTANNFTFSQKYDFSAGGNYNIKAWVSYPGDTIPRNDTLETSVLNPLVSNFPATFNFDNFTATNLHGWAQATYDAGDWTLHSGTTTSANTGPDGDNTTGSGQYFYIETSSLTNGEAVLESPCIDLDQGTFMFMEFYYHMHGATMGDLFVDVFSNGTWTNEFAVFGEQHSSSNDPWTRAVVDLSEYTGIVQVRFRGMAGSSFTSDMAIDDVMFFDTCASVTGGSPNLNFAVPDTVYVNSPADFNNALSRNQLSRNQWYLNGNLVSSDFHLTGAVFTSTGQNTLKLVSVTCYGVDSITKTITVENPTRAPEASFIADKNTVDVFEEVQLSDLSAFGATDWEWLVSPAVYQSQFGPLPSYSFGGSTNASSQNPIILFDNPGTYEICLVASNSMGSDTICRTAYITVRGTNNMCIFPFDTDISAGTLYDDGGPLAAYSNNLNCYFLIEPCASAVTLDLDEFNLAANDFLRVYDGEDNTGTPLWDAASFPNGMTGNITNASVTTSMTANSGKMYIEFQTNASGTADGFAARWSSAPGNFTAPAADFAMPDTVCVGVPASFENMSTGDNNNYLWDMDSDGSPESAAENITYTFPFTGTYDVTLTAQNCGGSDEITKTVTVISPTHAPNTDFTADITRPNIGEVVNFFDATTYCVENWRWEITPSDYTFVGGTNANSQHPQVTFNQPGYYDVKLVTSNASGADSAIKQQYILAIQYCTPAIVNLNSDLGISRFVLGDIDNSSDIGDAGYTDYAEDLSTELEKGATYTVMLERNTTNNPMNRKVWIDFNQDGDFDDPGELVAMQSSSFAAGWSDTFTVPVSAMNGATRLRVGTSYGSLSNTPCGPNSFGEYEDYRVIIRPDETAPEITLIGSDTVTIEQCRSYTDAGATATDNVDGNLTSQITVAGLPVDSCTKGMHTITYSVTDAQGNIGTAVRIVNVIADTTDPVLILAGNNPDTTLVHTSWTEPGYTATDNVGGTITSSVTVSGSVDTATVGTYTLTYTVADAEGNTATAARTVVVVDAVAPVIALNGADTIYVEVGGTFTDPGATATDNYDTSLTINVSGMVDVNTVGTYTLTYCTEDASGNPACIDRTVIVQDTEAPVVTLIGANPIIVEVYSNFTDPGINVTDNYYTNFTVTTSGSWDGTADSLGDFTIVYEVTDGSGNTATVTRTVRVVDTEAPVISLNGPSVVYLKRWQDWTDPWVTVSDNYDTNPDVDTVTNFSGTLLEGLYFITYIATDQSGNRSDVTRVIVVGENVSVDDKPEIAVNLYPNPNNGVFKVEVDMPAVKNIRLSVTDVAGKEVTVLHNGNSSGGTFEVNLSNIEAGIYFIRLQSAEHVIIKKMVVVN